MPHKRCETLQGVEGTESQAGGQKGGTAATAKASPGAGERMKTHLNREKAGEVVGPVVPSSHHNSLLDPVLPNGPDIVANSELHWQGYKTVISQKDKGGQVSLFPGMHSQQCLCAHSTERTLACSGLLLVPTPFSMKIMSEMTVGI